MRVTNSMLSNTFLYDLQTNSQNMQTLQQQMASGKIINKASDDPLGASTVMQLNTQMAQNTQYNSNISGTLNWLNVTDTSLNQLNSVFQRLNELMVSAGDASYGPDEKQSIKDEINTNIGQISQIMNTSYDGKYVFGGTRGGSKPVGTTVDSSGNTQLNYVDKDGTTAIKEIASPASQSDVYQNQQIDMIKSGLTVEISQGVTMDYSTSAVDIMEFNNDSNQPKDLRTILSNITSDLDSNNTTRVTGSDLSDIQDVIKNISKLRTEVGAQQNRMTTAQSENEAENTSLTGVLSSTDDVDMAKITMQYSQAQTVYLASLQSSAKILQPSLMDYL